MALTACLTGWRRRIVVMAAFACLAFAGAAAFKARIESEARARLDALGLRAEVSLEPFSGLLKLTAVSGHIGPDLAIAVGSLSIPSGAGLIPSAFAAQDVTLTQVSMQGSNVRLSADAVQVLGSNWDKAGLDALFDASDPRPAAVRLSDFMARAVVIPEVTLNQTMGSQQGTFTYRDVRVEAVAHGRFAAISIGSGVFQIVDQDRGRSYGSFYSSEARDGDLLLLAQINGFGGTAQAGEMQTLYASFSSGPFHMFNMDGFSISIARMTGQGFKSRSIGRSLIEVAASLDRKVELGKLAPVDRAKYINDFIEVVTSIEISAAEFADLEARNADAWPGDGVRIARIGYSRGPRGTDLQFEGIATIANTQSIGSIAIAGWSWQPTLDGLRASAGNPDVDFEDIDYRALIPQIGSFVVRDVAITAPSPWANDKSAANSTTKVRLKSFEVTSNNPVRGIPTELHLGLDRLALPIPQDTENDALNTLVAMGYDFLNLSLGFDGRWDEATDVVKLPELFISGAGMGRAAAAAEFCNIPREVFAGDLDEARLALLGASVKSLSITLDNQGLADRVIEFEAKKRDKTSEQLRKEWSAAASVLVPAMLGTSDGAKTIGAAAARFLAKPVGLTITAKAKNPRGLGLSDYLAAGSPQDLLGLMDIAATAD